MQLGLGEVDGSEVWMSQGRQATHCDGISRMKFQNSVLLVVLAALAVWPSTVTGEDISAMEYGANGSLLKGFSGLLENTSAGLNESGLKTNFDATYVFQSIASGGFAGPYFARFSDETSNGHTLNGDLQSELDTEKSGWWSGGRFSARLQTRIGRSAVQRAGSAAAINNEALYPNVEDRFDESVWALTQLSYRHQISDSVAVYGGLLNTSLGDENVIAGASQSHSRFLNFALLYSVVEDATTGNAALGGGVEFNPADNVSGSFSVYGSQETAGENPFRTWHGTTLNTEWTISHSLAGRAGAQTLGVLYGIDVLRTDIAADPRLVIISIILGLPIPSTPQDTWAFYYNAHQFIEGDEEGGWGVFARWGISDGNPNFVRQNAALGLGGVGPLASRPADRWGLGVFLVDMSRADLLKGLHITDEVGGEAYYNFAVSPSFQVTWDLQVIDSALPHATSVCVLGLRANYSF